jgi:predicted nucleic acid-binding protein
LELFAGSDRGRSVERTMNESVECYTTVVTLAEIVSVSARRGRPTEDKVATIRSLSKAVGSGADDAIEAGILHAKIRESSRNFSLADSFVLQAARKLGAKVLTGDPDFHGIKDAELI